MIPHFPHEKQSNQHRETIAAVEPLATRTYTPTQAVIAKSSGVFHWTPDGKRLFDFTSGVLVANLGHHSVSWTNRFLNYLGWSYVPSSDGFFPAVPLTAYNAITPIEADTSRRLVEFCQRFPGGNRLNCVQWAASGSEAVHKAIYTAMHRDTERPIVLATRFGFHGKKGLSYAVTGHEADLERDPRVKFISFPMDECRDLSQRFDDFDCAKYRRELDMLWQEFGMQIGTLITEPYLGGGGSYHPPKAYLPLLERFCREHDIVFILDEVQANFGRTGSMFAYSTYGIEPDMVVLGKGLGNGVPVAAIVGRGDLFAKLGYGDTSDTWSANPLSCAAVAATLDEFESRDVLTAMKESSAIIEQGLVELKRLLFIGSIRGEMGGMVWGVECQDWNGRTARDWANQIVKTCYLGDGSNGIHLLGPLAGKVIRISPPLTISPEESRNALKLMQVSLASLV